MISGALIAFLIIRQGTEKIRLEINESETTRRIGKWWTYIISYFIPVAAIILLFWWLSQSFIPGEWYNPFSAYSFMSCIFQWSVVLIVLLIFNKRIARLF